MDFKNFKKNQKSIKDSIAKLVKPANNFYADERFWQMTKDTVGNGASTIRFLPQKDPSKSPIQLTFRHGFQENGRWFIEECPFTIGEKCPVCEYSSSIWNTNEDKARMYWRNKSYIANILVVKDPGNPDNDGKVFLFKFGKKIYDMIMNRISPEIEEGEEDESINVFDFDEGIDFKMKMCQVSGFNNYDKSSFAFKTSAVGGGEEKSQEAIYNNIFGLDEFVDPKNYKTYDQLLKKLTGSQSSSAMPNMQEEIKTEDKQEAIPKEVNDKFDAEAEAKDVETDESGDIDFDALLADED